jgi:CheY-like chemotaxis protein
MQVKGFARGRDAVFAAEQRRFDVAIIDTNTKDIDGIRLAERLRRVPRGGVDRILLMEMPGQEATDTSMLPGIVQAIRKPIRMGNLVEILLRTTPDSHASIAAEPQAPQAVAEAIIAAGVPLAAQALPRVLVADDNAVNRKLVAKMLAKLGFECAVAENSSEAVSAVESSHFDAVLMDLQMPEMDGLEAMQQIRKRFFCCPPSPSLPT